MPSSDSPRSLAEALRAASDDAVADLLSWRIDLAVPMPWDLSSVAVRAGSRASVQRALDHLDTPTLQVVEVLALLPEPTDLATVARHWAAPDPGVPELGRVLARLRTLALVWGDDDALRLVRTVRDVLGPQPAGLGPMLAEALGRRSPQRLAHLLDDLGLPATGDPETALERLTAHLGRPEVVRDLLAGAPSGAGAILERLTWGPPVGSLPGADRQVRSTTAVTAVDWLLAHGLLAVADAGHVVLPREVGIALREGRVHRAGSAVRPPAAWTARRPRVVESSAAAAAAEAVRLTEALGELWGAAPPSVLRNGGLGVRELRRTAAALELTEPETGRLVEIAYAAGLVADDGQLDPHWAPTPAFDVWRGQDTPHRWVELTLAWLRTTRCPALIGTKDAKDAARPALAGDLDRAAAPQLRQWVLRALAAGEPAAAAEPDQLVAQWAWQAPRRTGVLADTLLRAALEEATWLGVVAAGALSGFGRTLLEVLENEDDEVGAAGGSLVTATAGGSTIPLVALQAADKLDEALPAPVDHLLLQADLTAVAPGPLHRRLAQQVALMADVESRGGATVYRFTPASIRRALDAGRTGDDLVDLLTRHSRTDVPQPLSYLIMDSARRHGRLRVGAAQAYLRADDESVLSEALADRRLGSLRLRRLAPTVLAAQVPPETVLRQLREAGYSPAAETPDGDVVIRRADEHRTPPRIKPRPLQPPTPARRETLLAAVPALRQADAAGQARSEATAAQTAVVGPAPRLTATDTASALALLRDAASRRAPIWVAHADAEGVVATRLLEPLRVDGGRLHARDRATDQLHTIAVARVTGVAPHR